MKRQNISDTPYLDKSLKWFGLPPHKRKQRLYKIVPTETSKFNETVVYNERKEGGGREIVVHCQPPKMNDDTSELVSLDSDQVVVYVCLYCFVLAFMLLLIYSVHFQRRPYSC